MINEDSFYKTVIQDLKEQYNTQVLCCSDNLFDKESQSLIFSGFFFIKYNCYFNKQLANLNNKIAINQKKEKFKSILNLIYPFSNFSYKISNFKKHDNKYYDISSLNKNNLLFSILTFSNIVIKILIK